MPPKTPKEPKQPKAAKSGGGGAKHVDITFTSGEALSFDAARTSAKDQYYLLEDSADGLEYLFPWHAVSRIVQQPVAEPEPAPA